MGFSSLKAVYSISSFYLAGWKGQSDNFTTAQIVQQLSRKAKKKGNHWILTPHAHKTPGWVWSHGCMSSFYFACWVRMLSGEACILQLLQANRSWHCSVTQTNTMKLSSGIKFKLSHWNFQFYSYIKGHLSEIFEKYITYLLIKLIIILIASLTDLDGFRKVI